MFDQLLLMGLAFEGGSSIDLRSFPVYTRL
jgi:hypothetical protein